MLSGGGWVVKSIVRPIRGSFCAIVTVYIGFAAKIPQINKRMGSFVYEK